MLLKQPPLAMKSVSSYILFKYGRALMIWCDIQQVAPPPCHIQNEKKNLWKTKTSFFLKTTFEGSNHWTSYDIWNRNFSVACTSKPVLSYWFTWICMWWSQWGCWCFHLHSYWLRRETSRFVLLCKVAIQFQTCGCTIERKSTISNLLQTQFSLEPRKNPLQLQTSLFMEIFTLHVFLWLLASSLPLKIKEFIWITAHLLFSSHYSMPLHISFTGSCCTGEWLLNSIESWTSVWCWQISACFG